MNQAIDNIQVDFDQGKKLKYKQQKVNNLNVKSPLDMYSGNESSNYGHVQRMVSEKVG
jgi:hypothetical protein